MISNHLKNTQKFMPGKGKRAKGIAQFQTRWIGIFGKTAVIFFSKTVIKRMQCISCRRIV
jgi:hypothetical protein